MKKKMKLWWWGVSIRWELAKDSRHLVDAIGVEAARASVLWGLKVGTSRDDAVEETRAMMAFHLGAKRLAAEGEDLVERARRFALMASEPFKEGERAVLKAFSNLDSRIH